MDQNQKVVVITGASRGIGADLVRGFREIGYAIVANSRTISASILAGDPTVVTVPGDIADPSTADRIVGAAMEKFGRIDTLVNNAGAFLSKPFTAYTEADFATITDVNVAGFFHVTQRAAAQMLVAGSGHIITVSASLAAQPQASVPAALTALTKGGLNAVTRALALEYAGCGIRVNAVSPGVIRTPMHPEASLEFLAGLQPIGRVGETREVVDAVLYLEGAAFITGEILHIDGGAHAGRW